jgi:dimethylhistidine N-methyltransferase
MTALSREIAIPEIASEVYEGLTSRPKRLCPKLFYDAAGSALFEEITRLPEYYLTRTEEEILRERADVIMAEAGDDLTLVELGAGSARKTSVLIGALLRRQRRALYCPIDVSHDALQAASRRLQAGFPGLRVRPVVSDYTSDMEILHQLPGRKLVLYIGSSIGNFEPEDALGVLRRIRARLSPGDALLLGVDLRKDAAVLIPAYDDPKGVTERFNKNVLARINRELGGEFDLERFRHRILWNPEASRIEMYLESLIPQAVRVRLLGLKIWFDAGELLHTENSYKYTDDWVLGMLEDGGFALENTWKDARSWFAVHLARVR